MVEAPNGNNHNFRDFLKDLDLFKHSLIGGPLHCSSY